MILQIRFQNFEKPENQEYVAAIVEKYRALLPRWLDRLTIVVYDQNEDAPKGSLCWVSGKPEYGFAHINILTAWFDKDADLQDELILHEILHIAHRRENSFIRGRLLYPLVERNAELHADLEDEYCERNEEFINSLSQGIRALLGETEKEASMIESVPTKCVECRKSPRYICPKCGDYCCGDKCAIAHAENCQKLPGYTCKLCGSIFQELGDFTKHAETCERPPELPPAPPAGICHACGEPFTLEDDFVHQHGAYWCLKCHGHSAAEPPKIAGNRGALDVQSWFQLREPTEQEAKDMDTLRATYTKLALDLEILCPAGADRMAALRLLKQSMHTAIGSIVTADAWQTPNGD